MFNLGVPPCLESQVRLGRPFVFLDTARPDAANKQSFLFLNPLTTLEAQTYHEVAPLLHGIDKYARHYWVAGYLSYEAAYGLDPALFHCALKSPSAPLGWFGVFKKPHIFNHATGAWNPPLAPSHTTMHMRQDDSASIQVRASMSGAEYARVIAAIKRYIARGDTYQINFTYDVAYVTPRLAFEVYCRLRESQPAPYCAFLSDGKNCVASFSPELFFKKNGNRIIVEPMKGTARRGRFLEEDAQLRNRLANDAKNQSENIMIVDLMRSDLGRLCTYGSVVAPRLFTVETLPTLHQMTSTVRGVLRRSTTLHDVFTALFPSGSVTGAPKIRSMEIIRSLEKGVRGVYCGAIGYAGPRGKAVFSVPIRTLQSAGSIGRWKYRVGSGIVWDSKAAGEWSECALKCGFLTKSRLDFELFESMLWNNHFVYQNGHIGRLKSSARYFGFTIKPYGMHGLLKEIRQTLAGKGPHKVRLFLKKNGDLRWDCAPLDNNESADAPAISLSAHPLDAQNPLLFHKTTHRPWYDADTEEIRRGSCFDVIHVNARGELTEGSRSNIFVKRGSVLLTPPVTCGLLPGVLRAAMLERGKCREEILKPSDLKKADALYCGNSVRGLVRVCFKTKTHT